MAIRIKSLQGILYNYIGCYTWISATYDVNGRFFAVNGKLTHKNKPAAIGSSPTTTSNPSNHIKLIE